MNKKKLNEQSHNLSQHLIGKKVISCKLSVSTTIGFYNSLVLGFDDGTKLDVGSGGGGCSNCDPTGIGWGISVEANDGADNVLIG